MESIVYISLHFIQPYSTLHHLIPSNVFTDHITYTAGRPRDVGSRTTVYKRAVEKKYLLKVLTSLID